MTYDAGIFSFLFFYFYREMMMLSCDFAIVILWCPAVQGLTMQLLNFFKDWFG